MTTAQPLIAGGVVGGIVTAIGAIIGKAIDKRRSPVDVAGDVVEMVERQLERLEIRVNRLEGENEQLRAEVASSRDAERDCRRRMTVLAGVMADAGLPIPDDVVDP